AGEVPVSLLLASPARPADREGSLNDYKCRPTFCDQARETRSNRLDQVSCSNYCRAVLFLTRDSACGAILTGSLSVGYPILAANLHLRWGCWWKSSCRILRPPRY